MAAGGVILTTAADHLAQDSSPSQEDSFDFVSAEVDAGGVASEGHVEGEFVEFAADGERFAGPRLDAESVVGGDDGVRDFEVSLNSVLRTATPAPPIAAVAPG